MRSLGPAIQPSNTNSSYVELHQQDPAVMAQAVLSAIAQTHPHRIPTRLDLAITALMLDRGASVDQITWYIASIQTEIQAVDAMTRLANFPTSQLGMPFDP